MEPATVLTNLIGGLFGGGEAQPAPAISGNSTVVSGGPVSEELARLLSGPPTPFAAWGGTRQTVPGGAGEWVRLDTGGAALGWLLVGAALVGVVWILRR